MEKLIVVLSAAFIFFVGSTAATHAQAQRSWVAPKAGVWRVAAKDEADTVWSGRVTLAKRGVSRRIVKYRGYFYWLSDNKETEGREYFKGSFDRLTGKLRLKAYAVRNVKGELGTGNYIASVNRKGKNIFRGMWDGENNIPGKWSAVWSKVR